MADRTIEISGIPFIPNEQLLVDFLESVLGNGYVRACRLMQSNSHESSTEGDRQVTAIVETQSAESAMTLHNLAKAGVLVFWCAALAVKFLPCPEPLHCLPPDLNTHDVPLDPQMCSCEQKNSTEDLLLDPDVLVSKVAPDVNFSEPEQLSEPRVSVPEVVEERGPRFYVPEIFGPQSARGPKKAEQKAACDPEILSERTISLPKDVSEPKVG